MLTTSHRVIAHTDHGSPWYFRATYPIGVEDLRDVVRLFADTSVDTFSFDAATWICWYDTKVGERYGDIGPPFRDAFDLVQWRSLNRLIEDGWDPPRVFAEQAHTQGMKCIPSIRMNDGHLEPINRGYATMPKASRWYLSHPEYRNQAVESSVPPSSRHAHMRMAMDYTHEGVRHERLTIISELASNYDVDGIELNFMRAPWVFPPGTGPSRSPIMTAFVERVREALDEAARTRGLDRRLELGLRLPDDVDRAFQFGFDVTALAATGAVDFIVADPFRTVGLRTDIAAFKVAVGDRCEVFAGIDVEGGHARPETGGPAGRYGKLLLPSSAMMRASALNAVLDGADGLAFFNSAGPTKWHLPHDRAFWEHIGSRAELQSAPRHYLFSGDEPVVVPVADGGGPAEWPFDVREDLSTATGSLEFRLIGGLPGDVLEVRVNGAVVEGWRQTFLMGWSEGRTIHDDPNRAPLPAHLHLSHPLAGVPLVPGRNVLSVLLAESDPAALRVPGDDHSPWARPSTPISFVTELAELEIVTED